MSHGFNLSDSVITVESIQSVSSGFNITDRLLWKVCMSGELIILIILRCVISYYGTPIGRHNKVVRLIGVNGDYGGTRLLISTHNCI